LEVAARLLDKLVWTSGADTVSISVKPLAIAGPYSIILPTAAAFPLVLPETEMKIWIRFCVDVTVLTVVFFDELHSVLNSHFL